jgi:hypothetical protein
MGTYSDYEQRLLDQEAGAELDRQAARAMDHVIDVMHEPPQTDVTKQLLADIRMEYEAGAQGYYLPRPTMKWLLAYSTPTEAPPAEQDWTREISWVIENGKSGDELRYRTIEQGTVTWTADNMKALRFARRADAEMFAQEDDAAWRIAEHIWSGPSIEPKREL